MAVKPIHDPATGPLRAVALMSGSGTNVRRILEHGERIRSEEGRPLFEIAAVFSDCFDSNAAEIGRDYDLPAITHDLAGWLKKHGVSRKDLKRREDFDRENVELLRPSGARVAIYGGYMAIASPTLIRAFVGVNVHPADLSVRDASGKRRWTGGHAVRDAIGAGEKRIHSSTHLVIEEVDAGPLLMISKPLAVEVEAGADLGNPEVLDRVSKYNQDRLKEAGDWEIFPKTIEAIARGWFQMDEKGAVYYKGEPAPSGVRL
ncbi:MAG TPA: formyltransferase family protein [bacterium]|nr:formyltransferase family protein [bacterium]